jgi:hypothetical protein
MEPETKKALTIAGIVLFTIFLIKHITNASYGSSGSGSSSSRSKTVVVNPNQRHYYGFNEPVHRNYNPYKAQYYN